MNKSKLENELKTMLALRKELVNAGQGLMVLGLNQEIANLASKLRLNYYDQI